MLVFWRFFLSMLLLNTMMVNFIQVQMHKYVESSLPYIFPVTGLQD